MTQQQQNMARMDKIDQFRYITIHTWLRRLGNKTKEMYVKCNIVTFIYIFLCSQNSVWTDRHTLLENGKKKKTSFFGATLKNSIGKSSHFTTIVSNEH